MRVCIISTGSIDDDRRAHALYHGHRLAGHEVQAVSSKPSSLDWVKTVHDRRFVGRITRRATSERLEDLTKSVKADLFVPIRPDAASAAQSAAETSRAVTLSQPGWDLPPTDLILQAPNRPDLSRTAGGEAPLFHTPEGNAPDTSAFGRVVVVYRKTGRNPGHYLSSGFRRAGFDVIETSTLDWRDLPEDVRAVVVVESPLPGFDVIGPNPGVPVVFWVHHGEHHLETNVRLQRRYGAHAIAMAHSWHLAYRFRGAVERVPFAVPAELTESPFRPHSDRRFDVGFVGSLAGRTRHRRRVELLDRLRDTLGQNAIGVGTDIEPSEMMHLYRDSRVVVDDGRSRHLPITMRVFEATGAGATLVSATGPGMDLLFDHSEYVILDETRPADQVVEVLRRGSETTARKGHARTWSQHTYEARARELIAVADRVRDFGLASMEKSQQLKGAAAWVDSFPDAQRVLDLEGGIADDLLDREVWDAHVAGDRVQPGTFHVAVVAGGTPSDRRDAVAAARTAIIVPGAMLSEAVDLVTDIHGPHHVYGNGDWVTITFGGAGYRVASAPDSPIS